MREPIPAVVTPLDEHMGLDIARALGRRGIPVYGIDSDPRAPGQYSKYCRFALAPDPDREDGAPFVRALVDFGQRLGSRAVLYPLSDKHALLCSRERATLAQYYDYVMPDHATMVKLATKDGLDAMATQCGVPAPRTIFVDRAGGIEAAAASLTYPVILKPTESTYWHDPRVAAVLRSGLLTGRAKVIFCPDRAALLAAYARIAALDARLVVQEVIPGEDSRLVYISFYIDRQGRPRGIFAGRKHRIIPTGFGSASYVRSLRDPELEAAAFKLLAPAGYRGLGGLEFKKDPRDERYKLVEFNTRFGMWDGLGAKCGVDLAYLAYCDALGQALEPALTYREGVIWVDWQKDARAALQYMRRGQLTLGAWLGSLRGEKMWAIYSWDDWRPGAAFTLDLARKFLGRLARR